MQSIDRPSFLFAVWLSALAGYIDTFGFLYLGGYFVSFMSGNSTRLVVALQEGNMQAAFMLAWIIALFVIGAMVGVFLGHYAGRNRRVVILGCISFLMVTAATANEYGLAPLSIALMVLSMGMENMIFQKDGDVTVGLTYMTGTLVKIGQKLAASWLGIERRAWVPYLLLWLGLMTGGFVGAVAYSSMGMRGLWFAAAANIGLTLIAIIQRSSGLEK